MKRQSLMKSIASDENLNSAWHKVRENRGAAGVDRVSISQFAQDAESHLQQLQTSLLDDTYYPRDLRHVHIPKVDGGVRPLAIPTVVDRVAQRAFVNVLEQRFEQVFLECSYGYRPGRGVADAVQATLAHRTAGYSWILDADVNRFFETIDHTLLLERLRCHVGDQAVLRNIRVWLDQGILAENRARLAKKSLLHEMAGYVREVSQEVIGEVLGERGERRTCYSASTLGNDEDMPVEDLEEEARRRDRVRLGKDAVLLAVTFRHVLRPLLRSRLALVGGGLSAIALGAGVGVQRWLEQEDRRRLRIGAPQGSPLSPLLANVYLHDFDTELTRRDLRLVRYADNFVICCASESRAMQAREVAGAELQRLRLCLNPTKTRIVDCAKAFVFLGYEFDRDGAFRLPPRTPRERFCRAVQTIKGKPRR